MRNFFHIFLVIFFSYFILSYGSAENNSCDNLLQAFDGWYKFHHPEQIGNYLTKDNFIKIERNDYIYVNEYF